MIKINKNFIHVLIKSNLISKSSFGIVNLNNKFFCKRNLLLGLQKNCQKQVKVAEFRYFFTSPQFRMKRRFYSNGGGYYIGNIGQTHISLLKLAPTVSFARVRDYRRKFQLRIEKNVRTNSLITTFHKFKSLLPYKIKGFFIRKQVKFIKRYIRSGKRAR